jgi:pseudouridine synthase
VGRLDYDTAGLLLLTNDGELAHVLTHPSFGVDKTYRAVVEGALTPEEIGVLRGGVRIEGGRAVPARVRVIASGRGSTVVDVTIHEGRNRQLRRMFDALHRPVRSLIRLRFGPLSLGDLPVGNWREATPREISALRRAGSCET